MNRRKFLTKSLATSGALAITPDVITEEKPSQNFQASDKILNAYYFRAHMYTLVPRHVREDMKWMADTGTNVVSIAILEQDLYAAVENIQIIGEEAARVGMSVYAVPSRWGGLLAGAPKVPSVFSVMHPQTWMLKEDGTPYQTTTSGVVSSIHYLETYEFFCKSVDELMRIGQVKGIIWDEPKNFATKDYSPKAKEALPAHAPAEAHAQAMADFYSKVNAYIREKYPSLTISMFVYANVSDMIIEKASAIRHLDYFGCDGRPWSAADGGKLESDNKVLIGPGEKFLAAARKNGKKGLMLIENHNMPAEDIKIMDKGLPKVLALKPEQLIYYYYPRNIGDPDRNMATIAKHVKSYRKS